jgi:hypothetical protein
MISKIRRRGKFSKFQHHHLLPMNMKVAAVQSLDIFTSLYFIIQAYENGTFKIFRSVELDMSRAYDI